MRWTNVTSVGSAFKSTRKACIGSLTTWNDEGKFDVSSEGPSSGNLSTQINTNFQTNGPRSKCRFFFYHFVYIISQDGILKAWCIEISHQALGKVHTTSISGFHSILLHRTTLIGGQLHTYCRLVPGVSKKSSSNCIYVLPKTRIINN